MAASSGGRHMAKMATSRSSSGGAAGADDDDEDDDGVEDEQFPPLNSNTRNTGAGSKGVGNHWVNGSPQHMSQGSVVFRTFNPAFANANSPTPEEITKFELSHTFIMICKSKSHSVHDIIIQVPFKDLNKTTEFDRFIPSQWMATEEVHMTYVAVSKDIPESQAKDFMKDLANKLPQLDIPMFNGADNGGQMTSRARISIETIIYFAVQHNVQPNLQNLIAAITKIVKNNTSMSTILDCSTPKDIRRQLQLGNLLGVHQQDIWAAFSSPQVRVSRLTLNTNRFTRGNLIITSDTGHITINHQPGWAFPMSVVVPSMTGESKTIYVTHHFEYGTDQPTTATTSTTNTIEPDLSATNPAQNPFVKTRRCLNPSATCKHLKRGTCLFAHDDSELRPKPQYTWVDNKKVTQPVRTPPTLPIPPMSKIDIAENSINLQPLSPNPKPTTVAPPLNLSNIAAVGEIAQPATTNPTTPNSVPSTKETISANLNLKEANPPHLHPSDAREDALPQWRDLLSSTTMEESSTHSVQSSHPSDATEESSKVTTEDDPFSPRVNGGRRGNSHPKNLPPQVLAANRDNVGLETAHQRRLARLASTTALAKPQEQKPASPPRGSTTAPATASASATPRGQSNFDFTTPLPLPSSRINGSRNIVTSSIVPAPSEQFRATSSPRSMLPGESSARLLGKRNERSPLQQSPSESQADPKKHDNSASPNRAEQQKC